MPQTSAGAAVPARAPDQPYRWRWVALLAILGAEVMDLLDALVTTVAAPSIQRDLGGSATMIQWLSAGYTLAMAAGLLTGGRLGDLYGRRRMFLIGAAAFTAASLLCGLAWSPEVLVAARVLQGLFGAVMIPQGLGMIKEMFPPREQAAALGAFGPVMAIGSVGGPVLAGWLVGADLFGTGWRMIFLINLPVGLLVIAGAVFFMRESRTGHVTRLDLTGVGIAGAAALLLIYPLVQGRELGWPAWTFVSMAASVALFAVFGLQQSRRQRAGGDPLVVVGLFRKRAFTGGLAAGLLFFAVLIGFNWVFSVYLQTGPHYTPVQAGLAFLPQAVGAVIGFGAANAGLQQRYGRTLIHAGTLVMGAGAIGLALVFGAAGTSAGIWRLAPFLVAIGLGMALAMSPFFDIALAGVEPAETGSASSTLTAVQQLGGAFGVALLGTVFFQAAGGGAWDPVTAVRVTLGVLAGMLLLTCLLALLMPKRARPEGAGH
ncbi:MFS transporter [Spongiactinospora gelatinilytica]|uniref:MFS transporter n=1 Tax=Spongiactinospora gelatinilytica TaxID=2666298 RepID=A0A2W2F622_9ACTN|nr:MFS transporter [Spongiactinospora gelatinilytica]PZG31001.1 MFS transporter [Spongiactinospora gelatinilytica]